jgi:hypothetical protein
VMTTADLLVLVLRVLPGEIRAWLKAKHTLPEKKQEWSGTAKSAGEGSGVGRFESRRAHVSFPRLTAERVCEENQERR